VKSVHNAIAIHPENTAGSKLDDSVTTGKVKAALMDDKDVKSGQINVETKGGVVSLSGFVTGDKIKHRAVEVAKSVAASSPSWTRCTSSRNNGSPPRVHVNAPCADVAQGAFFVALRHPFLDGHPRRQLHRRQELGFDPRAPRGWSAAALPRGCAPATTCRGDGAFQAEELRGSIVEVDRVEVAGHAGVGPRGPERDVEFGRGRCCPWVLRRRGGRAPARATVSASAP